MYAVGHQVVSLRGRWMAATLATGGVLSHRSAGALWGLRPFNGRIDVTVPWDKTRRRGLLLHRAVLAPDEITTHDGDSTARSRTGTRRSEAPPTCECSRHRPAPRDLEARFTTFLNDRRFPAPQTNVLIEGMEVDFAWPASRLVIELDSWEYHRTRADFENDRRKDRRLTAAGWAVLRVTWRDLDEPGRLAAELAGFF